ncbi:MAG: hypothetical protein ACJ741_11740 [Pyrinomonadaceae bacterium]
MPPHCVGPPQVGAQVGAQVWTPAQCVGPPQVKPMQMVGPAQV